GVTIGRLGTWGQERRQERGANVALRSREALGIRPAPKGVCHLKLAGRGQACGAKSPRVATSPEARTRVLRRRGGAPRGVAVCLCFPAIRETRRGLLTTRLSALPPPSPRRRARALNLPHTQSNWRAAMTLARKERRT